MAAVVSLAGLLLIAGIGLAVAESTFDPDNPFCDDEGNPLDEDEVDAKLEDYDEDGKIDGEEYTDAEIIQYLLEWQELRDEDVELDSEFNVRAIVLPTDMVVDVESTIGVLIRNDGEDTDIQEVVVREDGDEFHAENYTVKSGEDRWLHVPWTPDSTDEVNIEVETEDDFDTNTAATIKTQQERFEEWYQDRVEMLVEDSGGVETQSFGTESLSTLDNDGEHRESGSTVPDPRILDVEQDVDVPETGEPVTVTATVLQREENAPGVYLQYYQDERPSALFEFFENVLFDVGLSDAQQLEMNEVGEINIDELDFDGEIPEVLQEFNSIHQYQRDIPPQDIGDETKYIVELHQTGFSAPSEIEADGVEKVDSYEDAADLWGWLNHMLLNVHVPETYGPERYFTFKTVEDVAAIYADIEGPEMEPAVEGPELLAQHERRQTMVNEYMASWRGSYGAVGFDFTFYSNDGDWHTVESKDHYEDKYDYRCVELLDGGLTEDTDRVHGYAEDARSQAEVSGYNTGDYFSTIHISPGEEASECDPPDFDDDGPFLFSSPMAEPGQSGDHIPNFVYMNERRDTMLRTETDALEMDISTMLHELGHTLGHRDLYGIEEGEDFVTGEIGGMGIMGSTGGDPSLPPFSSVSKTRNHNLFPEEREDREEWPWLNTSPTDPEWLDDDTIVLEPLESKEFGDYVPEVWSPFLDEEIREDETESGHVYQLEASENFVKDRSTADDGVNIYWIEDDPEEYNASRVINLLQSDDVIIEEPIEPNENSPYTPTLEDEDDFIAINTSEHWVTFSLESNDLDQNTGLAEVEITTPETTNEDTFWWDSPGFPDGFESHDASVSGGYIPPQLKLRAFDEEGRMVGWSDEEEEYVVEIPGVDPDAISGNQLNFEWITTPDNQSIRYELDTSGVERYLDSLEEKYDVDTAEMDTETEVTIHMDGFTEDTKLNESTGELENMTSIQNRISLLPDERESVGASAITDVKPETLNRRSQGRWMHVNVTLEIPHDEIDATDINLSTVQLNQEVDAVTDERYGFTDTTKDNDTFHAKFDRQEVINHLDTGDNVTVFITAETDDDELITGKDQIRVIDRPQDDGPGETPSTPSPPHEGECPDIGPPEHAEGNQPPVDCPPGHQDQPDKPANEEPQPDNNEKTDTPQENPNQPNNPEPENPSNKSEEPNPQSNR